MPTTPTKDTPAAPGFFDPFAGFLSYLIPGLGQIYQGRVGKGLLFLVCLYALFFTGQAQGSWSNVYLPDTSRDNNPWKLPEVAANLFNRPQFAGQFWIGIAAWPAVWQYNAAEPDSRPHPVLGTYQKAPSERAINELTRAEDKSWDLAWVYTVVAGVLNILVIYDAAAGPAFGPVGEQRPAAREGAAA